MEKPLTDQTVIPEVRVAEVSLTADLYQRLLGAEVPGKSEKERLLEATGIDAALAIRREISATGKVSTAENRLVQLRNEIIENEANRLTKEDMDQVMNLNEYLKDEPELVDKMVEELIAAQEKMFETLGVGGKSSAVNHVREVVALVKKGSPDMPLTALMAAVHDMVKYTSVEGEDLALTAEHEVLSAVAAKRAGETIAAHLKQDRSWEGIVYSDGRESGVAKLFSYILTHGEGEYPAVVANGSAVVEVEGVKVGTMDGGEYIFNPGSSEVMIGQVGVDVTLARKMLEVVSGADKLVGMSPDSLVKYLTFTSEKVIFDFENIDDLMINQVMASFIGNYKNSPDSELKKDFLHSDEVHQSILILLSLRKSYQPESVEESVFNYTLFGEKSAEIQEKANRFKNYFEDIKNGSISSDGPKSMLITYFRELTTAIKEIDLAAAPELAKVAADEAEWILLEKKEGINGTEGVIRRSLNHPM